MKTDSRLTSLLIGYAGMFIGENAEAGTRLYAFPNQHKRDNFILAVIESGAALRVEAATPEADGHFFARVWS